MSSDGYRIRKAVMGDEVELTELSFASKRYWPYPDHYYSIWRPELTITGDYLERNAVYLVEDGDTIVGYYSLVLLENDQQLLGQTLGRGYWLDHMFVRPDAIGRGIGKELFFHLCEWCRSKEIGSIQMLADPYARGFYEKMGCVYIREVPSTIEGRTTPLLIMDLPLPLNKQNGHYRP